MNRHFFTQEEVAQERQSPTGGQWQQQPPDDPPPAPKKYSSSKPWIIGIILVSIIALGGLFGLLAYAANSASTPTSIDTSATQQDIQATGTADANLPQARISYGQKNCVGDTPPANPPTATAVVVPTVVVPKWTTTHTFSGNGTKKTEIFTVPDDWKLNWTCDPSSFYGGSYNVIVGVNGPDGTPLDFAAINTVCKDGNTGGSTEEHQGGQVYLDINSESAWTIQVQELR